MPCERCPSLRLLFVFCAVAVVVSRFAFDHAMAVLRRRAGVHGGWFGAGLGSPFTERLFTRGRLRSGARLSARGETQSHEGCEAYPDPAASHRDRV